ncbi:CBS domain protein [Lyngbya aestuarii BL J]|uniref:Zinc metalloprotease n=2 Tax=Lyngbya aestuarii TaxID=118322 RepID=U7QKL0_9CYAN|nr:CBS domain protein [Lyngbya aestuarii BL J]
MTLSYGTNLSSEFPTLGGVNSTFLGLVAALLLFASVLAHELGHSFVAIKQGINVKSITLFLFGGLASLDKEAKTPGGAFWIAIAGPAVSLALFLLLTGIGTSVATSGPLGAMVGLLAYINLALALFNLIPGLPLDGGNVLKALVWKITGKQYTGVIWASRVGQALGWTAIALGFLPTLLSGQFPNFWTILIGWFLLQNAGVLAQDATLRSKLSEFTAEDALTNDTPIISEDLSLRELANEYIIGKAQTRRFFIVNEEGELLGQFEVDQMKAIPTSQWPTTQVKDLIQPVELSKTIDAERSLLDVVTLFEKEQLDELAVMRNGMLVGLIEKASIRQVLQRNAEAKPA